MRRHLNWKLYLVILTWLFEELLEFVLIGEAVFVDFVLDQK